MQPEIIFETSWEVCQKIGGIYAVLSTRAAIMQKEHKDRVVFIGPDNREDNQYFKETRSIFADWQKQARKEGLKVRVGRWLIPGKPIAILVDFNDFFQQKNEIYYHNWEQFAVNSIAAYGDYDEASAFGYAAGRVIESNYRFYHLEELPVVAHFNEWMTSFGLFYVKEHLPKVGTLFTTHATSTGRSIAGNGKPLYDYFIGYNGDQMAEELNMVSKHSAEKQAALNADCFTTVSEITNRECGQLLGKPADVLTPNGFESEFVPKTEAALQARRKEARQCLKQTAEQVLGYTTDDEALFVAISGRYEWKNKGIDIFIESLRKLQDTGVSKQVVAFVMVPAWTYEDTRPCPSNHITTHQLREPQNDPVLNTMTRLGMKNLEEDRVKVIFVPVYLKGDDGVLNMTYYDLLTGMDLTVFPSYYEPWGYTPLESVAFHVPTVTTSLAGFGQWARTNRDAAVSCLNENEQLLFSIDRKKTEIETGVAVVERTDSNREQMVDNIARIIADFAALSNTEREQARKAAAQVAEKAEWKHFFEYYRQAYSFALGKHFGI